MTTPLEQPDLASDEAPIINEPRLWVDRGWTARVIKNNETLSNFKLVKY